MVGTKRRWRQECYLLQDSTPELVPDRHPHTYRHMKPRTRRLTADPNAVSFRRPSSIACVLGMVIAFGACSQDPAVRKQRYLESGNRYVEQSKLQEAVIEYRN